MSKLLNYKSYGDKQSPCLFIVHGLFGCLDNWMSLAKKWSEMYYVIAIDVRNHGKSFHSDDMSFESLSLDILNILDTENILKINMVGHSMGGKIVMDFAATYPEKLNKLIVADVAPYSYNPHHNDVFEMIDKVDLTICKSRAETEAQIRMYLDVESTVLFMTKNVHRNEETMAFEWKFNASVLERNYPYLIQRIPSKGFVGQVLFVGGENSDYISQGTSEHIADLYPNYQLEFISNAGHWLHADNPVEFYNTITNFINH
jgi:esterase